MRKSLWNQQCSAGSCIKLSPEPLAVTRRFTANVYSDIPDLAPYNAYKFRFRMGRKLKMQSSQSKLVLVSRKICLNR